MSIRQHLFLSTSWRREPIYWKCDHTTYRLHNNVYLHLSCRCLRKAPATALRVSEHNCYDVRGSHSVHCCAKFSAYRECTGCNNFSLLWSIRYFYRPTVVGCSRRVTVQSTQKPYIRSGDGCWIPLFMADNFYYALFHQSDCSQLGCQG
jgi:hypothetical protein